MTTSAKEVIAAAIKSRPAWNTPYSADADAILAALDAAGYVVVQRGAHDALVAALDTFVSEYVELVNSGDAGFWEPEDEPKVKAARSALALARKK